MSQDKSATYSMPDLLKDSQYGLGSRGFTIVELVVVIAILGILTALALPGYTNFKDLAREVRAMEEIRGLEKAINAYSIDSGGALPLDQDALATLVGASHLIDPWGSQYVYTLGGGRYGYAEVLNTDFDLYSKGTDNDTDVDNIAAPKSANDIVRASNGVYVGLGKNF